MRIPNAAHESRAWWIRQLSSDFRLKDAWELPTPGAPTTSLDRAVRHLIVYPPILREIARTWRQGASS